MGRGSRILIVGLLVTGSACARGPGAAQQGDGAARPDDAAVRLRVTNNYALPMEVYAVGSGITHRMGTVSPGMVSWFVLLDAMIGNGPVEFQAHPSADVRQLARSGQLLLARGQVVEFVIATTVFGSTATVRP